MKLFLMLCFFLTASATKCVSPQRTTPERCLNPPVIPRLNIPAYTGRWFSTFLSGTARTFLESCMTANYTFNADNTVDVLNCDHKTTNERPRCILGLAVPRPGSPSSRLTVTFGPTDTTQGLYDVVALLGRKNYGYFAAAVYSCFLVDGVPTEGFFILSRAPFAPRFVLMRIKERLRCKGYLLDDEFVKVEHSRMCKYFDGDSGFDRIGVEDFVGNPVR